MFPCRRFLIALTCGALLAMPGASLRAGVGGLQGAKSFQLFVTGLDKPASDACGLNAEAVKTAFLAPLEAAGAAFTPPSDGFWIALQTTTARREPGTCATFVDASVLQTTRYYDHAAADERDGKVLLWTQGELVLSAADEHGEVVRDAFAHLGQLLAEAWRGAATPKQVN